MNLKDSVNRTPSAAHPIRVSFPRRPVVFLDVVVRQYDRSASGVRHGRARLDRPPEGD